MVLIWIRTDGRHGIPQRSLKSYSHLTVTALWLGLCLGPLDAKETRAQEDLEFCCLTMMRPIFRGIEGIDLL